MKRIFMTIFAFSFVHSARAECNIANILFGKVRIEHIDHKDDGHYEVGIIFGNDFDSKRFAYDRMLGKIDPPERDGSRGIRNADNEECGRIEENLKVDREGVDCTSCNLKADVRLQPVGKSGFVVMSNGEIMGSLSGHLPRSGRY